MDEQEREDFIRKIGIAVDDSDGNSDEDEVEDDPDNHKYSCKKCQVGFPGGRGAWAWVDITVVVVTHHQGQSCGHSAPLMEGVSVPNLDEIQT